MNYRSLIFTGIILIALGVNFSTVLRSTTGTLGTVLIAVGGLFFIMGMARKKRENDSNQGS